MRPTLWRRSTHVLVGAAVLVAVALVVALAALLTGGGSSGGGAAVAATPAPAVARPAVVPVAADASTPTRAGLAEMLGPVLANPDLGLLTARITDAMTGTELWEQGAAVPMQPASTNKVLTTAAALLTLDRDARLTTTVVAADQARQPGVGGSSRRG